MSDADFSRMRSAMVDSQLRPNTVTDDGVVAAFRSVRREDFVPQHMRAMAYADRDIEVASGRYMLAPLTVGRLLQRANIRQGDETLLIGDPTGYTAALLAELGAKVSMRNEEGSTPAPALSRYGVLDEQPGESRYGLLFIEGMVEHLPDDLVRKIADGGRIAAIIAQDGASRAAIGRVYGGHVGWNAFAEVFAAPLPAFQKEKEFTF